MGEGYYARYFNLDEAHEYVPKVVELLERNDLSYRVSFFQQVRTGPGQEFRWHLSTARVLAHNAAGQPLLVICFSVPIAPQSHLTTKVQRLLDENTFLRQHAATFASLTTRGREVLRQLAAGRSSPEIRCPTAHIDANRGHPPPQPAPEAERQYLLRTGAVRAHST